MSEMVSTMLRLFREGVQDYQPATKELSRETGDPQVSLANLERILAAKLRIQHILIRPTGVLFTFSTGEQFYATGFRVGTDTPATEGLAQIAAITPSTRDDEIIGKVQAFLAGLTKILDKVALNLPADKARKP